jgi:dGTP triphosphohydrolase
LYGSAANIVGQTIGTCMLREIVAPLGKMSEESTVDEIPEDAKQSATKHDITIVKKEIQNSTADLRTDMSEIRHELRTEMKDMRDGLRMEMKEIGDGLRSEMKEIRDGLRSEMKEMKDEILHHFDVAVENIEDSLRGANADEISLMKNNLKLHKERLDVIEERVGLR